MKPMLEIVKGLETTADKIRALLREGHLRAYAGVIAWKRPARPDEGEFGEPEVLFQAGDVPDME